MGCVLKEAFLNELKSGLNGLPQQDLDERLSFYGEMIDDRMEEGLSEEEAVAAIGPVDGVVNEVLAEIPLSKIVKEKMKPKRGLRAWEIVLLILGFPLWFPLSIVAFVLLFVFYIVVWVLVVCLWAVELAFALCAIACVVVGVIYLATGYGWNGVMLIGAGLILAGLTFFLFFGCKAASIGAVRLAKKLVHGIKRLFVGKEKTK